MGIRRHRFHQVGPLDSRRATSAEGPRPCTHATGVPHNDGLIDEKDDTNGDHRITAADGGGLNPPIDLDRIRAVRVWLLSVCALPVKGHLDNRSHIVGDRIIPAANDEVMRRVLEATIECRNL